MTQAPHYRTASQRRLLRCTAVGLVMALAGFEAYAAPGEATIPAGVSAAPTIATHGSTTDITLNQSRTLIDWSSFNIGKDETVNFRFGAGKDIVLNRISGAASIDGSLNGLVGNQVGGNVWLYGAHGVVFGPNARVNVGGLLATTSPLFSDADFLTGSGNLTFKGGLADAGVLVRDGARLTSAGALALLAPSVATEAGATVNADGTVLYGAAENFRIRFDASAGAGFDLIEFEVPTSALEDGTISATPLSIAGSTTGSNVMMAAVSRPSVMNALISIDGTVTARSAVQGQGGEIILSASGAPSKTTLGAGALLDASSVGAGQAGGKVAMQSDIIDVHGAIDASGPAGGGSIKVGGGFHGQDASIANSQAVFVDTGARLNADATASGNGGQVVVWSDRWTGFNGLISARGGPLGGDGGRAEVSSKGWLGFGGAADLRAPGGRVGGLLLDPSEIRIVSGVTAQPATNNYTPAAGVASTDLGTTTIFTQLALGDLTISTNSASTGGDGKIEFVDGLNYIGAVDSNVLTLAAENGFVFSNATPIRAGGVGGFNVVLDAGTAAFATGSAVIDTRGSAGDGSLDITGAGISIGGALSSGSVTLTSTGGAITESAPITAALFSATTAGAASDITLTSANKLDTVVDLAGANIALTNDQAVTVTATGVTGAGTLNLTTTTGDLMISGALTRAGSITLASAGTLSADAVTASTGDLSMKGAAITFGGAVEATAGDVTLETTGGQLNLTQAVTTGATKTATLKSSADIVQSAVITAGTVTGASVGGAALTEANVVSNLGAFTNTGGGDIDFTSNGGLTVTGAVTNTVGGPGAINLEGTSVAVNGALNGGSVGLTATGGAITQSATITTTAGFSAEATGGALTLTTSGNKLGGTISSLQGTTVSLKNDQATSIAASNIASGGALSLETTTGALTVTGGLSQAGTVSLTAAGALTAGAVRATTGNVAMKGSTITFNGAVRSDAGSVSLETTGGALALTQTVTAGTSTSLTGSTGITQTAIVTTSGLSVDGGTGNVTLTSANKISGNLNGLAGVNVSLTNDQALTVIPNVTATGNVTLTTTTGGLTVSGGAIGAAGDLTLTAAGALNLDSSASSSAGDLSLKGSSINFVNPGSLSASSGDVSLETTGGGLTIDRNVIAGASNTVTLKSTGAISQTAGAITGGAVTGSSVGGATLTRATNAIDNLGAFNNTTSGAIALVTANDLTVTGAVSNTPGAINLTGKSVSVDATLTSGAGSSSLTAANGSITQSAAITAVGFSAQATGGSTTLGGANQISGTVSALRGQSVTFNNGQATTISGVTVDAGGTGNVSLSTTSGALTVPSISTAGSIVLDSAGAVLGNPNLTSTGSSISVASHGATMDLGTLSATNATAGDITLNANGEDITFAGITAGRDLNISGEDISTAGTVSVGRDYMLTGETFSPFVLAPTFAAGTGRDFAITDTLGGFTGSNITAPRNLTITATDAGNNAPISLTDVSTTTGTLSVNGSSITLDGAINVGSRALSLIASHGAVTQSGGLVTAGVVSGSAVTGFTLDTVAIPSLGAISNTTSGGIRIGTSTALDLTGNLTAAGQLVQVVGNGGAVTQSGGVITAQQLNIGGGSVSATRANAVDILRVITTSGDAEVNNSQAVRLDSSTLAGNLKVTAAGDISVNGAVTAGTAAGTQSVELVATGAGAITDTASGRIVGGVLKGSSGGGFTLDSATNDVGSLQNVTDTSGTGITYKDGVGTLNVSNLSAVNGPISVSAVGNLAVTGAVTGSTSTASPTTLVSTAGAVSQTSAGVITAGRVTGSAVTGFNLGVADNAVSQLGAVTNTTSGGIALKTTSALTLPGAITASGQTVALTSAGTIAQTGGGLITAGTLNATGVGGLAFGGANQLSAAAALTSTGAGNITLTNGAATGLTVSASTTGDITLSNNGALTLGNIAAGPAIGPQTASFTSVNGAIGQTAGTGITAGTVTGSAAGVLDLTTSTTNAVSHIGAFSTSGTTGAGLASTVALSIDGAVSGGTGLAVFSAPGLTLSSTGSIASTGPAGGVRLTSTGAGNALTLQGVINTGGAVELSSAGVVNQTAGTITGGSLNATGVGGITLGAVNAGALTGLSNSGSGDIVVTDAATTVTAGPVTNTAGKVTVSTPNGSLAFSGAVQGSGDIALTALTTLSGTTATSTGGTLSLNGAPINFSGAVAGSTSAVINGHGGNVTLGGLNSGSGDATVSGGAIAINGPVTIGRDYFLTGSSFNAGALAPTFAAGTGRDFILNDTAGGLIFTNLSAPRDLTIVATNAAPGDTAQISGGGLNATTGKITVTGTRVTLTGAVTAPAGDITLTSTVGGIAFSGPVTSASHKVTLASAGAITESGAGAVTAARLSAASVGGLVMGGANNVPIIDNLTNTGAGGVIFRNTAPATTLTAVATGSGDIDVQSTGAINLPNAVTAPAGLRIVAGGALTGVTTSAATTTLGGNGVALTSVTSTGATTVQGGAGLVNIATIGSGAGALTVTGGVIQLTTATSGQAASVTGTGNVTLGTVTASGAANLQSNATLAVTTVQSGAGGLTLTGATVNASDAQTTGAATVTATNGVSVTTQLKGATGVTVAAGASNVALALVDSGTGALSVTGGPVQITTATAGTTANVTASGALNLTSLTSGQSATLTATGGLTAGAVTAGGAASLQSNANLAVTTVQSGAGGLSLNGVTVNAGDAQTTGAATVTATNGVSVTTRLKGGTGVTVNAGASNVGLALVDAGTGPLSVIGGPVQITTALAGTTADVTSATTLNVTALTAGQGATLQAGGALTVGTAISTGSDLTLKGAIVNLTSGSAGRDALVAAGAGSVQIGDLAAVRDAKLSATGDITANLVSVGRDLDVQAGGDLNLRRLVTSATSNVTLGGRDVTLGAPAGATPGPGDTLTGGIVSISATRDAAVNVSGPASLALLKAGRDARLSTLNGDASATSIQAGGLIAVNAQNGSASIGGLTLGAAGVSATLTATSDVTLGAPAGAVPSAGQVISIPTTATLILDGGRDVTVNLATGARFETLKAGRDVNASVTTGDLTAATTTAGRNAQLTAAGGAVSAATATATGDLTLLARSASLTAGQAGGALLVRATAQDARVTSATGANIAVSANAGAAGLKTARLTGPGALTVTAATGASLGRLPGEAASVTPGTVDVPAGAAVTVKGATALVDLTGPANLTRVEATAGDATVRSTGLVTVAASGALPNGVVATGAVNVTGATGVSVSRAEAGGVVNLTATTGGVTSGLTKGTVVTVTAPGAVTLAQTTASGTLTATGQTVSVGGGTQTGGALTLTATGGAVTAADAVTVTGDVTLKATGGGATVSGVATATGKAQVIATGPISINSLAGDTVLLRGSDLALTGALRATKACAPTCADPTLIVESADGGLNLGDATSVDPFPTAPMSISKAEFSRVRGDSVTLYAGDTTSTAKRGEVRIGDLSLDLAQVDTLTVLAGGSNTVQVTGAVLPGAGGGSNLVVGGADASKGWTPKVVYVTGNGGGLGGGSVNGTLADQKPLKSVTLNAVDDVLLGSPAFVAAINQALAANAVNTINIIRNSPVGVQAKPADLNRVFLAADTLTLRANGVIVQQNSSFVGNQTGIVLTNRGAATTLATFGRTGSGGASLTPQLIDLSLGYFNSTGALIGRSVVAASPNISLGDLSRNDAYRINGCAIGVGGACTPLPNTLVDISIGKLVEGVQLTTQDAPPSYDPTITGAGNEEIWRTKDCNQEDNLCR